MPNSSAPTVGVVNHPEVAQALRELGFKVVTADGFRDAATLISGELRSGAFPVVAAESDVIGFGPWASSVAGKTTVILLRTRPDLGLVVNGALAVDLPATVNTIMPMLGFQASLNPGGDIVIAPVFPVAAAAPEPLAPVPVPLGTPAVATAFETPAAQGIGAPAGLNPIFRTDEDDVVAETETPPTADAVVVDNGDFEDSLFGPAAVPVTPVPIAPAPAAVPVTPVPEVFQVSPAPAPVLVAPAPEVFQVAPVLVAPVPVFELPTRQAGAVALQAPPAVGDGLLAAPAWDFPAAGGTDVVTHRPEAVAQDVPPVVEQAPAPYAAAEPAGLFAAPSIPGDGLLVAPAWDFTAVGGTYTAPSRTESVALNIPPVVEQAPAPYAAGPAEPFSTPGAGLDAAPAEDDFFAARAARSPQAAARPAYHHGADRGKLLVFFSGKGGVGKTSGALCAAKTAAAARLRTVLIDANRGQADVRTYLGLPKEGIPTVYDAVRTGDPSAALVLPAVYNAYRHTSEPLDFALVQGPPRRLADPAVVTAEVYGEVIDYARSQADLVVLDTQILEAHKSDLFDRLIIPAMLSGAWSVAIVNESRAGVDNLLSLFSELAERGVTNARSLIIASLYEQFDDLDQQAIERKYGQFGSFAGSIGIDPAVRDALNLGNVYAESPAVQPVIRNILHRVTGNPVFAPLPEAPKRKRGFFGRRRGDD